MKAKLLFILLILIGTQLKAQKNYEFDFSDKSLYEAIKKLSSKHKFKFSYNPSALKKHKLDKSIKANTEAELISKIFEDLPFKIQVSNGVYLIIPQKIKPKPLPLAGSVYDKDSGKPLAFAHVQTSEKGTISNQNGRFTLPPREDTITISVSYIGYKDVQLEVPPNQEDIALNLELNPYVLQEVILNTSIGTDLSGKPGFFSLNPEQFNSLPTLGGTDVFKSIQLLPGVQATDETASGLSVRGGTPAQNLIQMDGFTLYHLDHFFGIFSTLNPNMINNVSVFKGGFGSQYGGRISSVVDVSGRVGTKQEVGGQIGVNLLAMDGYIETPIGNKTSFIFGMRQSLTGVLNSDLFRDFLTSNRSAFVESINPGIATLNLTPSLNFYDINSKIQHRFSSRSILDVNFYLSEDDYTGEYLESDDFASLRIQDLANWSNSGLSASWKYNFSPKWYSSFTLGTSNYREEESLGITQTFFQDATFDSTIIARNSAIDIYEFGVNSTVNDVTIKTDHEIDLDNDDIVRAGIEINSISTNYETDQFFLANFAEEFVIKDTLILESNIISGYGSYQFNNSNVSSTIGLRSSYYEPTEKWYVEPRFDINFKLSEKFSLKGAASFHHQFVNQTSLSFFDNDDKFYWVLADDDVIPILKSTHLIFGGSYSSKRWLVDLEYYRKNTNGILENRFVNLTPAGISFVLDQQINLAGDNLSEGLDIFVKYHTTRYSSWLSYSLARSENSFWYINQNTPYPSNQDQRHEINLTNQYKVNNWEFSSLLLLGSGRPFTIPILNEDSIITYDEERLNDQRLPGYFRVDLSAKYSFSVGKTKCNAGVTLFNLFGTQNIKSRRFTQRFLFDEQEASITSDQSELVAIDTNLLGFTPNFFISIRL